MAEEEEPNSTWHKECAGDWLKFFMLALLGEKALAVAMPHTRQQRVLTLKQIR